MIAASKRQQEIIAFSEMTKNQASAIGVPTSQAPNRSNNTSGKKRAYGRTSTHLFSPANHLLITMFV
jgi:hypothetical protein